jgi:hypothetical protein
MRFHIFGLQPNFVGFPKIVTVVKRNQIALRKPPSAIARAPAIP